MKKYQINPPVKVIQDYEYFRISNQNGKSGQQYNSMQIPWPEHFL